MDKRLLWTRRGNILWFHKENKSHIVELIPVVSVHFLTKIIMIIIIIIPPTLRPIITIMTIWQWQWSLTQEYLAICGNGVELEMTISPWSYWRKWEGWVERVAYRFMTLSSISAEPRNREKHPGLQRTQPNTCSVAFWNQWPTAYSKIWYHTIGPAKSCEGDVWNYIQYINVHDSHLCCYKVIWFQWQCLAIFSELCYLWCNRSKSVFQEPHTHFVHLSFYPSIHPSIQLLPDVLLTSANGMDASTCSADLDVFAHAVKQKAHCIWLEINVPIQCKDEGVVCLEHHVVNGIICKKPAWYITDLPLGNDEVR